MNCLENTVSVLLPKLPSREMIFKERVLLEKEESVMQTFLSHGLQGGTLCSFSF